MWNEGLTCAQEDLRGVGVFPDGVEDDWFYHPQKLSGVTDRQLLQEMLTEADDDDQQDVRVHQMFIEGDGNGHDLQEGLVDGIPELRAHIGQIIDEVEENSLLTDSGPSHIITVPNHGPVHKSTLIAQLNNCDKLSMDRIARVRKAQVKATHVVESSNLVGLFDDVAVKFKANFKVEWIIHMRNKTKNVLDYARPVSLSNSDNVHI